MQNIGQSIVAILIVAGFVACPGSDSNDPQDDAGHDAGVQFDVAQQQDSSFDARADVEPQQDAATQQDATIQQDAATQQDAEPQQDVGFPYIAAEVMYEVDGRTDPVWDGVPTVIAWVRLTAVNMDSEVTKVRWTFTGVTSNNVADATLLLDGIPLPQQDATWVSNTELEFTTSASLTLNVDAIMGLEVETHWAICGNISADISADTDMEGSGGPTNPTVFMERASSIVPSPVPVEGIRFQLNVNTPSYLPLAPSGSLLVFDIISTFDAEIRHSPMTVTVIPINDIQWFWDFSLYYYWGSLIEVVQPVNCGSDHCELNFSNNFNVVGNCQVNSFEIESGITSQPLFNTALGIGMDMSSWEVVDMSTAAILAPEYLVDSIQRFIH